MIGVMLCSLMSEIQNSKWRKLLFSWWVIFIEYVLLVVGVTIAVKHNIAVGDYMLYSWVALPLFMLQILSLTGVSIPQWMQKSKVINYFCEISYAFFLAQFFVWETTKYIIGILGIDGNIVRIGIAFLACIGYAILLHEFVEKPVKNWWERYLGSKLR